MTTKIRCPIVMTNFRSQNVTTLLKNAFRSQNVVADEDTLSKQKNQWNLKVILECTYF